jgi:hypothetical protein
MVICPIGRGSAITEKLTSAMASGYYHTVTDGSPYKVNGYIKFGCNRV